MYTLDRLVKDLQTAHDVLSRMDPRERPLVASLHVEWALNEAKYAATALAHVDCGVSKATNPPANVGQPLWEMDLPASVDLECPHCHAMVSCEVNILSGEGHMASAQIEHDECCEDCGKPLCPKCQRFPHPDDAGLVCCGECAATIHGIPVTAEQKQEASR